MTSVYIHIPFCSKICSYCDFCKVFYNSKLVDKYLKALANEVKNNYRGELIKTIYIGGGTPSSLSIEQLTELLKITEIFNKSETCEFTIEGNFESTDFGKLELYKKYGVNRLSFGVETTNPKLLKILNRDLDQKRVINIINYCKSIGLDNINVDLIYALPGETIEDLKDDLDFISSLGVKHISTYSLIIEDNTVLSINKMTNIDEDLDYEMYRYIERYLNDRGFIHYEISNFSLLGFESKHNLVYWNNLEYYGFGVGASSYIGNRRSNNTRSITKYCLGDIVMNCEDLDMYDTMEYEIMLGLRTIFGIDKDKFRKVYGNDLDKCYNYDRLIDNGFILEDNGHVFINPEHWYISNRIIVEFLEGEVYGKSYEI